VSSAGTVAGRLYGLSTIGSIVGTFLPALVTIPLIGTQRTLLATALALALAAILLLGRRALLPAVLISALLAVPTGSVKEQPGLITETESPYQFVQVLSHPDGARDLEINEGRTSHSVWRSSEVLTGGEWDMFLIVPALLHRPVQHILIIGNAGGTTARALGHFYPQADVDGVELDPTVTDLGRRWLGLGDNPRLRVHDADGRPFLEVSKQRWDLIFVDAYRQPYIPFQLATSEFFALVRDHLQPDGLLALNVERIPGDEALARTVESTVATAFASVWRWPALRFSELVVAGSAIAKDGPQLGPVDHRLQSLSDLFNRDAVPADRSSHPMSDDRAPIEWLTDRTILEYIVSGRQMDEQLLPTWPGWNGKGG
jgi:spermidine synthase